jgi:uncharacterized protein
VTKPAAPIRAAEIPVVGPLGPAPDRVDEQHWLGLNEGELRLQRCRACQEWIWGPQWICGRCHSFDLGWDVVEPVGSIFSWTRSWHLFSPELAPVMPVVTVIVELPAAGGRRVIGMLVDSGPEVRIGDPVHGVFEKHPTESWTLLRWVKTAAVS